MSDVKTGDEVDQSEVTRGPVKEPVAPPAEEESRWEKTRANIRTIAGAVFLAMIIRIVLFEAFEIEGPSMEPTLLNGDRVVVAKFMYGLFLPFTNEAAFTWGEPDVGDVVIVRSPSDNIDIVKRVIGVPGDTIEMRDNVVWRNGSPIPTKILGPCQHERADPGIFDERCWWVEEKLGSDTYVTSRSPDSPPGTERKLVVPEGHVYILGDHRDRSNDSRNVLIGPVKIARVKGKALAIYWSSFDGVRWNRLGTGVR